MSKYLQRYPEVSGELRLSDRMVNLVEEGVDLAVRIGHLPDSRLVARHVGEMRRIVVASKAYLRRHGEPKTPEAIASHDTIQFGAMTAALDWRLSDGREIRVSGTPRFTTNSADAAIHHAEAGGGLTRVLAYQAAERSRPGSSGSCSPNSSSRRCRSTSSIRRRGCCRPRCATFIDLVTEISDWHFGG